MLRILVLMLLLIGAAPRSWAGLVSSAGGNDIPTTVDADTIGYERDSEVISATGAVNVQRGDFRLLADEIRLNQTNNEVQARGNVWLVHPDGNIEASSCDFNLDDETGFLRDGKLHSQRFRYTIAGDLIEKGLGQTYRMTNGRFTTCGCDTGAPSWSISGEQLDVTVGGYGILKNGTFNILDVPVVYLPRAFFPVRQERQSGLLRPRFGYSSRRGVQTVLPFYYTINKSHDVTVGVDVETNARLGLIGDYRYAFSRQTRGTFEASYFNELLRGRAKGLSVESRIPENRWSFRAEHDQGLPAGAKGYVDGLVVSDDGFFREINIFAFDYAGDVALRTLPYTETRAGAVREWDHALLKMEGVFYQDIDLTGIVTPSGSGSTEPATRSPRLESLTLQRAPEISLAAQSLLGNYLLTDFNGSIVDYQRGQGLDGFRLDLGPSATLPLPLGRYVFGSIDTRLRETAYQLLQTSESDGSRADHTSSRELLEVHGQVGTALTRVFPVGAFGIDRVQHIVEPMVEYLYVPSVGQSDSAFFDSVDRINERNLVTAGVVTRIMGKSIAANEGQESSNEAGRELVRAWVAQSADINRHIARIDDFEDRHAADHFSDLDVGGLVHPNRSLSLRFQSHVDTGNGSISGSSVGFFVQDPRERDDDRRLVARTSAGVSYRFLRDNLLDEIQGNAVIGITQWLGFFYAGRYDLIRTRFLDNHFGLRLISTCDCWAVDVGLTDRSNPNEIEARVQITLVGLGYGAPSERVAKAP